jgi:hypothetical protein
MVPFAWCSTRCRIRVTWVPLYALPIGLVFARLFARQTRPSFQPESNTGHHGLLFKRVKIFYTELESFLARTPADTSRFWCFSRRRKSFEVKQKTSGQGLLVIGNEAKGISEKVACFVGKKSYVSRVAGRLAVWTRPNRSTPRWQLGL